MASVAGSLGAYLADSLKIFVLPVTTIRRATERNLGVGSGLGLLALLTIVAGLVRLIVSYVPGGTRGPLPLTDLVLEEISYFLFFVLSYLVLFALVLVFGGSTNLGRLLSAKLSLASALIGAFVLALLGKLLIGLFFLGSDTGVAGGLYLLGAQFGTMAIGLILAVYTVIVARFGGELSWLFSVIVGVIHLALMVALYGAYQVVILQNHFGQIDMLLQS